MNAGRTSFTIAESRICASRNAMLTLLVGKVKGVGTLEK
jgi:hypothetical protein